ncbi:MCE family protein [Nocardioides carbamazepini]|uniref:MCE family protein n=1 Tax=Nocardioides carbamazepini TaxID=2854259 RepID=UPI002149FF3B|nr:MlaD family protein [Nocardioides carbamazepini]MCR1786505.1 MCE family protein [Nocardioides carbamazepini]
MSGASDRHHLRWTAVKALVFTVVTVLATMVLALTIRNDSGGDAQDYAAVITDATSVSRGDDVRMAGVKVGSVRDVKITDGRLAKVRFTVRKGVRLPESTIVQIRFRNLVGQRYLALVQPSGVTSSPTVGQTGTDATAVSNTTAATGATIKPGHTFGVDQTRPALDLTLLFNGFQPLLRMLDPDDVNRLSEQIIAVFQGEGATVEGLLKSTASLTTTLAEKDQVIGDLITSLSSVLTTVNERSGQLDTTLLTMQQLVSGLAEDRAAIGGAISGMGDLTTSVADLLGQTRPAVRQSIKHLGKLSQNLDEHSDEVESFLELLPVKLDRIGRLSSYGSWLNTYLCSMEGRIPMPQGYMGDLGALPVAERCH